MVRDIALLLARAVIGGSIAGHGAQKAFGWFEGPGPQGAAGFMDSLGFKPGARYAALSSYTELTSGVLIALGLGGALGPAMLVSVMIVAATSVHAKNGYFAQKSGIELPTIYVAAALALAGAGNGALSLDRAFAFDIVDDERLAGAVLVGGAVSGVLALRQRVPGDAAT